MQQHISPRQIASPHLAQVPVVATRRQQLREGDLVHHRASRVGKAFRECDRSHQVGRAGPSSRFAILARVSCLSTRCTPRGRAPRPAAPRRAHGRSGIRRRSRPRSPDCRRAPTPAERLAGPPTAPRPLATDGRVWPAPLRRRWMPAPRRPSRRRRLGSEAGRYRCAAAPSGEARTRGPPCPAVSFAAHARAGQRPGWPRSTTRCAAGRRARRGCAAGIPRSRCAPRAGPRARRSPTRPIRPRRALAGVRAATRGAGSC